MSDRPAPTLDHQLDAVLFDIKRWREIAALYLRARVKPEVIDEIADRVLCLEAAADTLREAIAAAHPKPTSAGSERAA